MKEELLIKTNVKNPVLKQLLNMIEEEYNCLLTNTGTVVKVGDTYKWFSIKCIVILINELDKKLNVNNKDKKNEDKNNCS